MTKKPLSILLFGNTNNYPLLLAEAFRGMGHTVRLLVNRRELLHRPESKYPEWKNAYPEWIKDFSHITPEDIIFRRPSLIPLLSEFSQPGTDLAILNDLGPSLAGFLKSPHVSLLTGSDLLFYSDFSFLEHQSSSWSPGFKRSLKGRQDSSRMAEFVVLQRDGILTSDVVSFAHRGLIPEGDRLLDSIGVEDERRMMVYMSNTAGVKARPNPGNAKLRILCGSRLVFNFESNPDMSSIDFKGTDVLLEGYARYCREGGQGELRLPIKGQDVEQARSLVRQLGLEDRIVWLDEMSLKDFYEEMTFADLVCDQFGTSFPGMTTMDAYALGRPVMARFQNNIFSGCFGEALPGLDVSTPEEIARQLTNVEKNPKVLEQLGQKSRAFAEKYLSPSQMAQELLNRACFKKQRLESDQVQTSEALSEILRFKSRPRKSADERVKDWYGDLEILRNNPRLLRLFINLLKLLDSFPGMKKIRSALFYLRRHGFIAFTIKLKDFLRVTHQKLKLKIATGVSLHEAFNTGWPDTGVFPEPVFSSEEKRTRNKPAICLVTANMSSGGAERQVAVLACELQRQGYQVRVRVMSLSGENAHYLPYLRANGVDVAAARFPGFFELRAMKRQGVNFQLLQYLPEDLRLEVLALTHDLLQNPVDLVHCYLDWPCCYGGFAALLSGVPHIRFSWRNVNPTHFDFYRDWMPKLYQFLLPVTRIRLENNTAAGAANYAQWLGLDPSRIEVIANGLDPAVFETLSKKSPEDFRKSLGIDKETPLIVSVSRLSAEKRVFDLPEILSQIHLEIPEAVLVHVGTGPLREALIEAIKAKGLSESAELKTGRGNLLVRERRENIGAVLLAADVFLLTSAYEGMPNAVMEAMFHGVPVVATRAGGLSEIVQDGVEGFLHDTGDTAAMAESLNRLLKDPVLRQRMGNAGKEKILSCYTVQHLAERVTQAYARQIDSNQQRVSRSL